MNRPSPDPSPEESPGGADPPETTFFGELKRRKVIRVGVTYSVAAWLIIQVAAATFTGFGIPEWAFRFVVIMLILAFPVALVLAWAFELTPDGVKLTRKVTPVERAKSSQKQRNLLAFTFAAGLPTLIFGTLAVYFYIARAESAAEAEASFLDRSIAVLPFRNVSADEGNAFFCDGVHEDILTTLANIGSMRVISRTSVMRYRDSQKTVPEIGRELGVSYILEGSVQREGSRVRITGQLINARTDEHIWAKNYDRELTDIFLIQAEISKEIAQALQTFLTPDEVALIEREVQVHPAAYDLVLKGRSLRRIFDSNPEETLNRSVVLFQAATEMDPNYAEAWVELAFQHVRSYFASYDRTEARLNLAKASIERAMELNPRSTEVLIGMGNHYYYGHKDYGRARSYYERALQRSPNNASAFEFLAYISEREGKWEEALRHFEQSRRLDPNNEMMVTQYVNHLLAIRRYDEAVRLGEHLWQITTETSKVIRDFDLLFIEAHRSASIHGIEKNLRALSQQEVMADAATYLLFLDGFFITRDPLNYLRWWELPKPEGLTPEILLFLEHRAGIALKMLGREAEAEALFRSLQQRILPLLGDESIHDTHLFLHVQLSAHLGDRQTSIETLDRMIAEYAETDRLRYVSVKTDKAICLIHLGEEEAAIDLIEELLSVPYSTSLHLMNSRLSYYPIWDHPRFIQLVEDPAHRRPLF
jgi:TolB-like protein